MSPSATRSTARKIPATPPLAAVPAKDRGTERWPAEVLGVGDWIQVPKVVFRRLAHFKLEPRHLWLLLVLQTERFRDRPPRYYWEELAQYCGKDKNTVRKWGYELKRKGLLQIKPCKKLSADEKSWPGRRNERSIFLLEPFEARVAREHAIWRKDPTPRRKKVNP